MRFLGRFWPIFAISCFAALVGFFIWNAPPPAESEIAARMPASMGAAPDPGLMAPAKPSVPEPSAVARGERSLAGREPDFVKKMSEAEKQEFYAQLDEIDRVEKENNLLQETEVLDESLFGMVQDH